jgi:hypothetical protein
VPAFSACNSVETLSVSSVSRMSPTPRVTVVLVPGGKKAAGDGFADRREF